MELDFDKDIDALLRKAVRDSGSVSVGAASGGHMDADIISAFAANDVPAAARQSYTLHLAECDQCRKLLALTVSLNEEAEPERASSVVAAPAAVVPWYRRFLGLPALAYTMGALALLLSGFIGYAVLQRSGSGGSEVSQVYDTEPQKGGPSVSQEPPAFGPSASNSMSSNTSSVMTNSAVNSSKSTSNTSVQATPATPVGTAGGGTGTGAGKEDRVANEPVSPPPLQPPAVAEQPMTEREVVTADKSVPAPKPKEEAKEVEKQRAAAPAADDAKKLKDQAPAAALSGPAKSAQARRDQNAAAGALDSVSSSEIRSFGGKSFRQKNGIWYDSAYAGQSTKKVKRSADDYKKLDGGLRSIADSLGGTVVIVWNGKAYKIQ